MRDLGGDCNRDEFHEKARELRDRGWRTVNPAKLDGAGWESSRGARLALAVGGPVFDIKTSERIADAPGWMSKTAPNPETFEETLDSVLADMRWVMIERQRKYGPDNICRLGLLGVLARALNDKIERIRRVYERKLLCEQAAKASMPQELVDKHLPALGQDYGDELIEDAHIDAANYLGPISLMLLRGIWGLPLEEDVRRSQAA